MAWLKWIVVAIGILMGGWMTFDGSRAWIRGDYVTPSNGPYAGQLGPWAGLVRGAGIEPRSGGMKTAFVILGVSWLVFAVAYGAGVSWARPGLIVVSVASLWYVPAGTVLATLELILLFVVRSRAL